MKLNFKNLTTEKVNEKTTNIFQASTQEIVKLINNEDKTVAFLIESEIESIAKVIDIGYQTFLKGGRIIYIGAGTSGRIGILDASEILPTFGVENRFLGIIAGGKKAILAAQENAEDNKEAVIQDLLKINFNSHDLLIGISASGRTPYVKSGLEYAHKIQAKTSSITTVKNSEISEGVDVAIEVETGPEVIVGSTRMKSGTAQKMVLNMISTGIMIKAGKVYQNYMVNVVPTNQKLKQRAKNIIKTITQANDDLIEKIFKQSQNVVLSIIMIQNSCSLEKAKLILEEKEGLDSK